MAYSIHGPKAKTGGAGPRMSGVERIYLVEVFKGMIITAGHILKNIFHMSDMPTLQYPDEKPNYGPWLRGRHRLMKREEFSKDELAYCRRDLVTPSLFDEYHTIEEKVDGEWVATPTYESGWSFWNGNIVGGSSNFMSGMLHRLHPDDFRLKSKYGEIKGANVADWPISYNELEPYYALAEELVGISGHYEKHPFEIVDEALGKYLFENEYDFPKTLDKLVPKYLSATELGEVTKERCEYVPPLDGDPAARAARSWRACC